MVTRRQAPFAALLTGIAKPLPRANAGLAINVADALAALSVPELPLGAITSLKAIVERADDVGTGVPVAISALLLKVSEPTVRSWVDKGVLEAVADSHPLAVRPRSLGQVLGAVTFIRQNVGEEPRLLNYLSERLEFDDLRSRIKELGQSIELTPGKVEEELFS
jgi:hypothetical protein